MTTPTAEAATQGLELDEDTLLALAQAGVERAKRAGADEAEVYLWHGRRVAVEHSGKGAHALAADQSGVSVRVAFGRRVSGSAASGLLESDIAWTVDQAVRAAALVPDNPSFRQFPDAQTISAPPTAVDPGIAVPEVDRMLADVDSLADAVKKSKRVSYFNATMFAHTSKFAVANGRGVATWDQNAYESLLLEVRATGAGTEKYASEALADRHPLSSTRDLTELALGAVARAESAANPQPLPGFVHDVLFDATTAMQLIAHLSGSFSAANVRKGKSRFAGHLGDEVASPLLTITEEPRGPHGSRNQRVDDEGTPTQALPLIEKGVLRNFLYDQQAAGMDGVASNGHGLRPLDSRYAGAVGIRPANVDVAPGDHTIEEMVESADKAVLVRDFLMGTFTMNNLTGDFSFVAPVAFYVEDGKVRHGLVSTTVAGNLFDALKNLAAVGREQRSFRSGRAVPLHVTELTCAT